MSQKPDNRDLRWLMRAHPLQVLGFQRRTERREAEAGRSKGQKEKTKKEFYPSGGPEMELA